MMSRALVVRMLVAVFSLVLVWGTAGCDATGSVGVKFQGEISVEPLQVPADGRMGAEVSVLVYRSGGAQTPLQGLEVEVQSLRNRNGEVVDTIEQAPAPTDADGRAVAFVGSQTVGVAELTATVKGEILCVSGEGGTCTPAKVELSFVTVCEPGLSPCGDGCVDLTSDTDHCGECDNPCLFDHAGGYCDQATCFLGDCEIGFGNCNFLPEDGCEVDTQTSVDHCGSCEHRCGDLEECLAGRCVFPCHDQDEDGYDDIACGGDDCNDQDPNVSPGSQEWCNDGKDNDCNGDTDSEDLACFVCQADADCDDGDACTGQETCLDGACQAGQALECNDQNPCTNDACDPLSGCAHVNNTSLCDDGDDCTMVDYCANGVCSGVPADMDLDGHVSDGCGGLDCDDGDPNVNPDEFEGASGTCDDLVDNDCDGDTDEDDSGCGACTADSECDDQNACNGSETCLDGACQAGADLVCDDGNDCTSDSCNALSGCINDNNDFPCDDGDRCTENDICTDGSCVGGSPMDCDDQDPCTDDSCDSDQGCQYANNSGPCDDGDACTEGDLCLNGACFSGTPLNCDDGNQCTDDSCDTALGCLNINTINSCTDGDACTVGDECLDGVCVPGTARVCDDANLCTDDSCDPAQGCVATDNSDNCSDGDACTVGDQCSGGTCQPGSGADCDDSNPCTDDSCNSAIGCVNASNTLGCDDGNACTENDVCADGACFPGSALNCDDGNPCTDDSCDPASGCVNSNNTVSCDDGSACTVGDVCQSGSCTAGAPRVCDDGEVCTDDSCDPSSGCTTSPNSDPCDDGDACTESDSCSGGACQPGSPLTCDDGDVCTDDSCNPASGCVTNPNTASCDDGNACTVNDTCSAGSCFPGNILNCDDGNPCTDDSCDPSSGCVNQNNTVACSDGDACTVGDICASGVCQSGVPRVCNDGNICTDDSCDSASGCVVTNNSAPCDDSDACTVSDQCSGGVCVSGAPPNCDDGNECTDDSCDSVLGCLNQNNTDPCDDAVVCTMNDVCVGGACTGDPLDSDGDGYVAMACSGDDCNDSDPDISPGDFEGPAGSGVCDDNVDNDCDGFTDLDEPSSCGSCNNNGDCDDGNPCNGSETCSAGACQAGTNLNCDDGNVCTTDSCVAMGGCQNVDNSAPCDDGDACTVGDTCSAGSCQSGSPQVCNDGNPCTDDSCDSASGCVTTNNNDPCDDGDACSVDDQCGGGACQPGAPLSCDDGDVCTDDSCDSVTGCVTAFNTASCEDGNACTENDACSVGSCLPGGVVDCDDGDLCTDDSCIPASGCVYADNSNPCDDGDACTSSDACSAGSCVGGGVVDCDDGNVCTDNSCDSASGCQAAPNSDSCDDGDACTENDSCSGGSCQPGSPLTCDDGDVCTDDSCNPASGCATAFNTAVCDDGNACTQDDECSLGSCLPGDPVTCDDGNVCTDDSCDPASGCQVSNNSAPCSDGDQCTLSDQCSGGSCQPGPANTCDDGNDCTDDSCDSGTGCRNTNDDSNTCDDGDPCTDDDNCSSGSCVASSLRDRDNDTYEDEICGGDDCDDLDEDVNPGATEVCDGADNDCDTLVDQRLCAIQEGACNGALQQCASGMWAPCNYSSQPNYQHVETLCDSIDNDCDGCTDEGCAGYGNPVVAVEVIPYSSGSGFRRISGNGQAGPAGALLPNPLIVQLNDGSGNPIANEQVLFTVAPINGVCYGVGGPHPTTTSPSLGTLNIALVCNDVDDSTLVGPTSVYTNENGQAQVGLRLSNTTTGMSAITATVVSSGDTLDFFASSSAVLGASVTLPTASSSPTVNPAVGPLDVTVRPGGTSQAYMENENNYQLLISALSAADASADGVPQAPLSGGDLLTITGQEFAATGNQVWIGGQPVTPDFESPSQIDVTLPEGIPGAASVIVWDGTDTPFQGGSGNIPSKAAVAAPMWRLAPKPIFIFADTGTQSGSTAQVKLLGLDVCGNSIDVDAGDKSIWTEDPDGSSPSQAVSISWVDQAEGIAQVANTGSVIRSAYVVGSVDVGPDTYSSANLSDGNTTVTTVDRALSPDMFEEDSTLGNTAGVNSIIFRGGANDDSVTTDDWTFNPAVRFSWVDMDSYSIPDGSGSGFETEAHIFAATMIGEGDITYVPGTQRVAAMAGTGLAVRSGGPEGLLTTVSANAAYHMRVCVLIFICRNVDGQMDVSGIALPGSLRQSGGDQDVELNSSGVMFYSDPPDDAPDEWRNLIMNLTTTRSIP